MTADKPSPVVPNLRFPEFRNAADWKTKILGTQGTFLSSLTGKTAKDFDTGDAAFIPYMNVFSNAFTDTTDLRSVNVADDESQSVVAKGDVFFTVSSETPEEAGMSGVLLEEIGNCYLNSFCALFRFDEGKSPDPVFLGYLLRSAPAREHLSRGAQGATRYNISRATFRSLPILIPSGPEQKKIADCLGSLDDLIAAERRKLEALRQHKQGLMQQLLPQPGETVPRLRFPKFEGAGDWEEKQLSSLVKLVSGVHLAPDMYSTTGEVPYFTGPSDCTDAIQCVAKWTDESVNIAKQHDTLITVKGSGVGKIWYLKLPSIAMGRQLMAVRTEIGDRRFIYQFLSTRRAQFEALASGNLIPGLSRDNILGMAAYFPSRGEQQKIADCLGSLDDLIAAEGRKLEALRQHKQGLMQQLFPSLEAESR